MKPINKINLCVAFLFLPILALATPNDHNEPYHISSDSATFYRNKHTATFIGNVKGSQGNTKLSGEKVVLYLDSNNKHILRLIDYGKPARYSTIPDKKKERLHAQADIINYYPPKDVVTLTQNAIVTQGQNKITGDFITYDTKQQIVKSKPTGKNARTVITVQPQDIS